jgi:hypothetical protein
MKLADNVVDFQRLVDLGEPFRPVRRPPAAAFIKRQLELAQQARYLFPRRDMAAVRPRSERGFVYIVERSQTAREELAIDHALGKAVDRAETEPG